MRNTRLDSLARSYRRLSQDVGGRINFALDLDSDDALDAAEREKEHLDQAFFVLSFAALEYQVTMLASAKLATAERKTAMREADFERRWDTAVKVAEEILQGALPWKSARPVVLSWYRIRSDIAHGRAPSQLADVPSVIFSADDIAETLDKVEKVLSTL